MWKELLFLEVSTVGMWLRGPMVGGGRLIMSYQTMCEQIKFISNEWSKGNKDKVRFRAK